ncbi:MAG TPA: 30S ribosomal protein S17 [Patescibacteria group bacterium]
MNNTTVDTQQAGKTFEGVVVSTKMMGTISVELSYTKIHPKYRKIFQRHKKVYADNNLNAKEGDIVKVRETRPLSKMKRFTTLEIIKKA